MEKEFLLKLARRNEPSFYKDLNDPKSPRVKENSIFRKFLPKFYGIHARNGKDYLVLENLIIPDLKNASVIDFKMGKLTYG